MELELNQPFPGLDQCARQTYLITYSQCDETLVPSKQVFADMVMEAFEEAYGSSQPIIQWACGEERHADGNKHFHIIVKLSKQRRWKQVKELLETKGIVVHFADGHGTYRAGYLYVTKEDPDPLLSNDHPKLNIIECPSKTAAASLAVTEQRIKRTATLFTYTNADGEVSTEKREVEVCEAKEIKKKRLSKEDVSYFVLENGIKNVTELYAVAQERKDEGEFDLSTFILHQTKPKVAAMISDTWEMMGAKDELIRKSKSRYELLLEEVWKDCVKGCNGRWFTMAIKVLALNDIDSAKFSQSLLKLLKNGRGKNQNILITGPPNCAKTFLLRPLCEVFRTFSNPAVNKYCWVGAEESEVIFLNDFRWSREMITWQALLLLLEGIPSYMTI